MKKFLSLLIAAIIMISATVPTFAVSEEQPILLSTSSIALMANSGNNIDIAPSAILRVIVARILSVLQKIENVLMNFLGNNEQPTPLQPIKAFDPSDYGEVIKETTLRIDKNDLHGWWVLDTHETPIRLVFVSAKEGERYFHALPENWQKVSWKIEEAYHCLTLFEIEQKQAMSFCLDDILCEKRYISFFAQSELDMINISGERISTSNSFMYTDIGKLMSMCASVLPDGSCIIKVSDLKGKIIPENYNVIEDLGGLIYTFKLEGAPGNYRFIID